MSLSLLEVVTSVQRIQPRLKEELGPFSVAENNVVMYETRFVLRQNNINVVSTEMTKSLDDAVRRHNGLTANHQRLQLFRLQHNILE